MSMAIHVSENEELQKVPGNSTASTYHDLDEYSHLYLRLLLLWLNAIVSHRKSVLAPAGSPR